MPFAPAVEHFSQQPQLQTAMGGGGGQHMPALELEELDELELLALLELELLEELGPLDELELLELGVLELELLDDGMSQLLLKLTLAS